MRDFDTVQVWGRNPAKAASVVEEVAAHGLMAEVVTDLDAAVGDADVISCVTGATEPIVRGALVKPGGHVDLIVGFSPEMREADDDVVRRASVFVEFHDDAEIAGDIASRWRSDPPRG